MTSLCIVVPVLDEGEGLAAKLAALRPLRERGAQLVVVDGGSTDATWFIARAAADRVLLAPQGRGAQMNAGAGAARAEWLLFLHADTVLPPDADRLVFAAAARGARWGRFDVRIDGRHPLLRLVAAAMNIRSRWSGIATGDQAMFVRRDVFARAGGFADLPLMEDIALSAALRRQGPPACIAQPVLTSGRRWERQGVLRTIALMWSLRARYFFGADPGALALRYGYRPRPPAVVAAVAVLAKAPVPGLAKTRLAATLGARAAARAQRRFTLSTLASVQAAGLAPSRLWCAPDATHRLFRALRRHCGIETSAQPGGDLGARMQAAVDRHFADLAQVPLLLAGTDCPLLAPGHLQAAARALAQHDVVLIPAEDGGYVLIGLRKPVPDAFRGIRWSTPQVLAETRERLRAAGASWFELPPLWDVDEAPDWDRYQRLLATAAPGR